MDLSFNELYGDIPFSVSKLKQLEHLDYHPENVFSSMVTIMSLVLEESEDISFELISPILASVKKDNQEVLPIARKLGERVFKNCAIKVKPYLMQAMKSLGLSSDDYIKVISSICDGTNGAVGHNDDNACGEQLVTNSRGDFYHSADYSLAYSMRKMMSDKALNYNALGYDDKILDGFYDLHGILTESTSSRMPSLVDLQGVPMSDNISWEAIMVNRAADANLLKLEQKALEMAVKSRSESLNVVGSDVVRKLAALVSDYMGGSVGDPDTMLRAWKSLSYSLKATLGSMVLPLGSLTIGLPRHRALLFKVLADSVGIPCRLVKGQQYTGSDDFA